MERDTSKDELAPVEKSGSPSSSQRQEDDTEYKTDSRIEVDGDLTQNGPSQRHIDTGGVPTSRRGSLKGEFIHNKEIYVDWNDEEKFKSIKNREKKLLAADLGIDLTLESSRYNEFLELAINVALPVGWRLEETPTHKIYYYNDIEGKYSSSHPCLDYFKKVMNTKYRQMLKKHGLKVAKGSTARHTKDGILL